MDYLDTMGYPYIKASDGGETPVPSGELPRAFSRADPDARSALVCLCGNRRCSRRCDCACRRACAQEQKETVGRLCCAQPADGAGAADSFRAVQGRQITNVGQASSLGGKSYPVQGRVVIGRDPAKCQVVFPAKTPASAARTAPCRRLRRASWSPTSALLTAPSWRTERNLNPTSPTPFGRGSVLSRFQGQRLPRKVKNVMGAKLRPTRTR